MSKDPKKRTRDEVVAELGQQLLGADPRQMAQAAKGDAQRFAQLVLFAKQLGQAVDEVKKEELADQAAVEESKRQRLLVNNQCFHCETSSEILSPCADFQAKHNDTNCHGTMLCEKCIESTAVVVATCPECVKFLCKECDPGFKCHGCSETFCMACSERNDIDKCNVCDKFYCLHCAKKNLEKETCICCSMSHYFCDDCGEQFNVCEGECEQPVCDECLHKFRCGNDAPYCGECEFDCVDCDMCAGYY